MRAVAEVVPLSPPKIRLSHTAFLVPVKLAPVAAAANAYRSVPVGVFSASRLTPSITPSKLKNSFLEGAGRDGGGESA
jgi:hypothetical protein